MRTPAFLATVLFSSFLTACGGGEDPVAGSAGGTTTETDGDGGTTTVSNNTDVVTLDLGSGTGDSFQDGVIQVSSTTLASGGTTQITVDLVDAGNSYAKVAGQEFTVTFSSDCASRSPAKATFSEETVETRSGSATVTYSAKGCSGDDLITAIAAEVGSLDALALATTVIEIAPPEIGTIRYTNATDTSLSISGIGNAVLPKLSELTFQVVDTNNNPVVDRDVTFEISSNQGGVRLAKLSERTDENGEARTTVLAGASHGIVTVRASTMATDGVTPIYTSSQPISITTGIADQDSFSLVLNKYSTWGWNTYGAESDVEVTAIVNDQFQNPVADGTVVNFRADAGSIPSTCETLNGRCTVTWRSANPLPGADAGGDLFTGDDSRPRDEFSVDYVAGWNGGLPGVASITAYTIGEAGFSDANGNGLFDAGESYTPLAEAFVDANDNGIFDYDKDTNPREALIDFDGDDVWDDAPEYYQGITCAEEGDDCLSLVHVRDSVSFIVADSSLRVQLNSISGTIDGADARSYLGVTECIVLRENEVIDVAYNVSDINGNIPPVGTTVSFDIDEFDALGNETLQVKTGDFGTNGFDVSYSFYKRSGSSVTAGRPELTIQGVDGVEEVYTPVRFISSRQPVAALDTVLVEADETFTVSFEDVCGNVYEDPVSVVVELNNGQFPDEASVKSYDVLPGDTLALDITSDGASNYSSTGLSLRVLAQDQGEVRYSFPLKD